MSARILLNSTNVRNNAGVAQETGRVLLAAAAVWATVMAAAAVEGVADKFGDGALEAFGAAMALFAAASYRIDGELRAFARATALRYPWVRRWLIWTLRASYGLDDYVGASNGTPNAGRAEISEPR